MRSRILSGLTTSLTLRYSSVSGEATGPGPVAVAKGTLFNPRNSKRCFLESVYSDSNSCIVTYT